MMNEISVEPQFNVPEKVLYFSKLHLIVSKGGANSADIEALSFYI